MARTARPPGGAPDDDGTSPAPAGAAPPSAEFATSFLLHIRQRASGMAVDPAPGAATPAAPPDEAGAHMVQEARPTITGDEETYGDGAPGAPSRQEGPRGPQKRDRAAADPGTVPGGVPGTSDGTHASAVAHDTTRRRISAADTTSVLRRPLAITNASRRMNHNHHNPSAYADVNAESERL